MATHKIQHIKTAVNREYPGLGGLVSFSVISIISKRCLLVASQMGCGKTTAIELAMESLPHGYFKTDEITRAGIQKFQEELTDSEKTFYVEDLGGITDLYNLIEPLSLGTKLTYKHQYSKNSKAVDINISNFHGAFITSSQPEVLPKLFRQVAWQSQIRDRVIRYYHLIRPQKTNSRKIKIPIPFDNTDYAKVRHVKRLSAYTELLNIYTMQFSLTRAEEHISALLRALALVDNRKEVLLKDYIELIALSKPLKAEPYILPKMSFGSNPQINRKMLDLFIEFASHKVLTLEQISRDLQMAKPYARREMMRLSDYWLADAKQKDVYHPSALMAEIIGDIT